MVIAFLRDWPTIEENAMLQFFRIVSAFALATLVSACATGPSSPFGTVGNAYRSGEEWIIYGISGTDDVSAVTYMVPWSCFGKELTLSGEFRTPKGITSGTKTFHGVHVDYEMRRGGRMEHPLNYFADPSIDWQAVSRTWFIPPDATSAIIRVGLQGVSGRMEVRGLRVNGC